ncbi:MAG: amidase [Planctomycetes bacterium]|nr:amidase [Planctomycetota bacterium]
MMAQETLGDDILFSPIRDLAERLRTRRLTSVALTEAYLDRLQKVGPRLNGVVTLMRDSALKEARAADEQIRAGKYRGLLHGIPYGAKDLLATRGVPTTWGAEPFRRQTFDYDATVIRKLRDAGAVLLGKLAMVELAGSFGYNNADASFTGPCKTPWNLGYWSGGSSSGSGACVAAGLCAFAIGSETSGSIITPAAYCGVAGLRPTFGRVSRYGAMPLSWTLDKLGPMCRSADCCGIVLAAIAGRDAKDLSTVAKPYAWPEARRDPKMKYRVGVIRGSTTGIQPAVRDNFRESVKVLSRFCDITEDVAFPELPFGPAVSAVINAEGASAFRELIESGRINDLRTAQMKTNAVAASMTLAVDYLQALRIRTQMKKEMDAVYAKYDALMAPARTTVAYPIDRNFSEAYVNFRGGPPIIPAGNLVGQPAIAIPNGFGPNNLPTGIQFTGKVWSEARLLSLAHAYQQATEWHRRRPKM